MLDILPAGIIIGMVFACWNEENPKVRHFYLGIIGLASLAAIIML